eukprot:scaffold61234_cov14-Tisochrysis_lutea.AAC.1
MPPLASMDLDHMNGGKQQQQVVHLFAAGHPVPQLHVHLNLANNGIGVPPYASIHLDHGNDGFGAPWHDRECRCMTKRAMA